jgi:subtilase family serine protease
MKTITPSFPRRSIRFCGAAAASLLLAATLGAQTPVARIQAQIDSSQLSVIPGSQHALAGIATDLGPMTSSARINGITLRFKRSVAQEAALDALIQAQQNPASPLYHRWLTPDQFAARFGTAQSDIDKVENWLEQQGFTVDSVNRSRTAIRFSGTVSQVESAFATRMHNYEVNGEKHFAPSTALSVPAAMAGVVADIHNLSNFRPRAAHIVPRRSFTSGQTGNVFFAPPDIVTTYDIGPLYSAGIDGTGQTIAIMGQSAVNVADIEAFEAAAGLKKKDPNLVLVPGTGNSALSAGDQGESDLDLEWSGAIAPGANVVFVYVGSSSNFGTYDATDYAIDEGIGNIISMSYTTCELDPNLTASYYSSQEAIYKQAAAQGQTVVSASGDFGSAACYGDTNVGNTVSAQSQEAVNYPASSAYITAVGGTEIPVADGVDPSTGNKGANYSTYWSSNGSTDVIGSAKSYIPEITWNDSTPNCNPQNPQANCLSATGGGTSTLTARPSWQAGVPGIPSGSQRLLPDIAFYASAGLPGYLYCTSDQSSWAQGQQGSCVNGTFRDSSSQGLLTVAGGTSFGTPIFAGMIALLNQNGRYTTGAGLINPTLYSLAANATIYGSDFHDVTQGNNNCDVQANCASNVGYSAGTGYDEVTGLGSIDVAKLAKDWPMASATEAALIGTSVSVSAANATPQVNDTDVFTITVTDSTGAPVTTGTVTLQVDGGTNCGGLSAQCGGTTVSNQTLSATGQVSYTATFTTAGTHSIVAQYSGDATHAASTGVGSVSIAGSSSGKGSISAAATPPTLTVKQGTSGTETVTVTPSGGYTGTVDVNIDFGTPGDSQLANLCASFSQANVGGLGVVQITGSQPGSVTLTLDSNANDCSSGGGTPPGGMKPGFVPLRNFMHGHLAKNTPPAPRRSPLPPAMALAGLVLAGFLGRRRRIFRNLVVLLALGAAGMFLSACSSSVSQSGPPNPPKGTYNGTFTATDSSNTSISATATFKFVID